MLGGLSSSGAHGTLLQVVDPAEETFPYSGRVEFVEPEGGDVITAGRAETWAKDYIARVAAHRAAIREETNKLGWLFSTHTTDRSAAELLLVSPQRHDGRQRQRAPRRASPRGAAHDGPAALLRRTVAADRSLSLPALWWLLRVMPPRPRRIDFPPTRLLFDIAPKEETPSRTPWWLTLLRLLAAALVILAAAGPIWNPSEGITRSSAPLVLLLDDGWSAASSWEARIKTADELIANAESDRRAVAIVPLSETHPRHHADAGRHGARRAASAYAETLRRRARRDAAGAGRVSSPRPATARSSGSPTASIPDAAANSPKA